MRAVSFADAISFGGKWVTCLEKLPRSEEVEKKIVDARTTLGFYNLQLQHWDKAKKVINPIVDLA